MFDNFSDGQSVMVSQFISDTGVTYTISWVSGFSGYANSDDDAYISIGCNNYKSV